MHNKCWLERVELGATPTIGHPYSHAYTSRTNSAVVVQRADVHPHWCTHAHPRVGLVNPDHGTECPSQRRIVRCTSISHLSALIPSPLSSPLAPSVTKARQRPTPRRLGTRTSPEGLQYPPCLRAPSTHRHAVHGCVAPSALPPPPPLLNLSCPSWSAVLIRL